MTKTKCKYIFYIIEGFEGEEGRKSIFRGEKNVSSKKIIK